MARHVGDDVGHVTVVDRIHMPRTRFAGQEREDPGAGAEIEALGSAQLVLFPGESFVGYQLMAQAMRRANRKDLAKLKSIIEAR